MKPFNRILELTNKKYAQALELDLPEDVKKVVQRNRADESRHLEYVNECLDKRTWEHTQKGCSLAAVPRGRQGAKVVGSGQKKI